MSENESEHDRRVREYWANAYKGKNKNSIYDLSSLDLTLNNDSNNDSNSKLPYEPTAVLTSQNQRKPITFRELLDLDLRND